MIYLREGVPLAEVVLVVIYSGLSYAKNQFMSKNVDKVIKQTQNANIYTQSAKPQQSSMFLLKSTDRDAERSCSSYGRNSGFSEYQRNKGFGAYPMKQWGSQMGVQNFFAFFYR